MTLKKGLKMTELHIVAFFFQNNRTDTSTSL